jgi:hypothetical protein
MLPYAFQHFTVPVHLLMVTGPQYAVGIAAGCRVNNFHFSILCRPNLGPTQSLIQWVLGALSPGLKQSAHEAEHSPPTNADVNNLGLYIYSAFLTYCLVS